MKMTKRNIASLVLGASLAAGTICGCAAKESSGKCGASKCGSSKTEKTDKCGSGKCGSEKSDKTAKCGSAK